MLKLEFNSNRDFYKFIRARARARTRAREEIGVFK